MGGYHSTNVNVVVTEVIRLAHMPKMVAGNVFSNSQPLHRSKEHCVALDMVQRECIVYWPNMICASKIVVGNECQD